MPVKPVEQEPLGILKPLSPIKRAGTHVPFATPSSALKTLDLDVGDVFEAEFMGKKGEFLLIKVGGNILKALGDLEAHYGSKLFLKVLAKGPPLKVELLGESPLRPPETIPDEILQLKTVIIQSLIKKDFVAHLKTRWSRLAVGQEPDTSPLKAMENLKKVIMELNGAEGKGSSEDWVIRQLFEALGLEARIKEELGQNVVILPLYFDRKAGGGLLILKEGEEGESDQRDKKGRGPRSDGLTLQFDLYLTRLGALDIRAFFREKALGLTFRAKRTTIDALKRGMEDLASRLLAAGVSLEGIRYLPQEEDRAESSQGRHFHFVA